MMSKNTTSKIVIVSGTNRPNSQTRRVAGVFEDLYKSEGAQTEIVDLKELPAEIFRPEAYEKKPAAFEKISQSILNSSGLVIVTPEYNGSFPGVLKLFIDMLKFPESFERRPVAFVGLAAGMWGALRSVEQLESIFKYRNAFTYSDRIFLPRVESQLNSANEFTSDLVKKLTRDQVRGFIKFCEKISSLKNN